MFGLILGTLSGLVVAEFGDISFWWTFAFAACGIFLEFCIRLGIGEPICSIGEAMCSIDFGDIEINIGD